QKPVPSAWIDAARNRCCKPPPPPCWSRQSAWPQQHPPHKKPSLAEHVRSYRYESTRVHHRDFLSLMRMANPEKLGKELFKRGLVRFALVVRGSPEPRTRPGPFGLPLDLATPSAKCRFQISKMCIFLEEFDPLRQFQLAGG